MALKELFQTTPDELGQFAFEQPWLGKTRTVVLVAIPVYNEVDEGALEPPSYYEDHPEEYQGDLDWATTVLEDENIQLLLEPAEDPDNDPLGLEINPEILAAFNELGTPRGQQYTGYNTYVMEVSVAQEDCKKD